MAKKNREEKIVNKPFAVLKSMDTKNLEKGTEYTPHPRKASTAQQSVTASPGSQTIDQNPAERVIIGREEYANWLNDEPVGNHNPNPFDFVFLSEKPTIFEDEVIKTLEQDQDLYSGYLDIELITLTPVHIVGTQIPDKPGRKIARSCFYKEDNDYCIPGSSIKGMLRSFVEAITNGWVSQAQELANTKPSYPKVYGTLDRINGRHIGFDSYKVTENTHGNGRTSKIEPGIPCKYRTDRKKGLDISSYLFGVISEEKGLSRKHKLVIEDAIVTESDLHDYDMVDIEDSAFMGGAHPSASNWWYMVPSQIWERTTDNHNHVVEMIGEGFWGRKFYFHQDPIKCIAFYKDNTKWIPDPRRPMPLYPYPAACLDKQKKIKFRISVKRIPKIMLDLLCLCLIPGRNIRHKLGYGKQYGYGAVELEIKKAEMRKESLPLSLFEESDWTFQKYERPKWEERKQLKLANQLLIDEVALTSLAKILGWADVMRFPENNILCTYPPYRLHDFQTPIRYGQDYTLPNGVSSKVCTGNTAIVEAKNLWDRKHTIHFLLYQSRAKGYKDIIMARKP